MSAVPTRIFISTGEVSGDLQGSYLVRALLKFNPSLEIIALGGPRMAQAGAKLLADTSTIGSMGLVEALPLILPTLKIQRLAQKYLRAYPPDLVVYIDYLAPNMNLGQFVRKHLPQVPTVYYIAPQEWVWRSSPQNTRRVIRNSDLILAVFPQEYSYYASFGAKVTWVGHPLVDIVQTQQDPLATRAQLGCTATDPVVLLMPASRIQELKYILPDLMRGMRLLRDQVPGVKFWLPVANAQFKKVFIEAAAQNDLTITFLDRSYDAIQAADLVVGKSGTVNLETAILNVPQLVLYRISPVTYWIAKNILNFSIPFMSPVNLVTMELMVPEYLQIGTDPVSVAQESFDLLTNQPRRAKMQADYATMRANLGAPGVLDRAAQQILALLP